MFGSFNSNNDFIIHICIYGGYVCSLYTQTVNELYCFTADYNGNIYFFKKDLGTHHTYVKCGKKEVLLGIFFGGLIGFYDGVFGPGMEVSSYFFY